MGYVAGLPGVKDVEMAAEAGRHVVGVEDRDLGGFLEPVRTHHSDVHVRDGENRSAGERSRGDGLDRLRASGLRRVYVVREVRGKLLGDSNWTHSRTATSVRDSESFVEVKVADVGADAAGRAEADLGVHVGAVHVHLSSVLVDELADFLDVAFEDSVGGRVSDHECAEVFAVRLDLIDKVIVVDVALLVALDSDDLEPGHDSGSRVGAVGGDRDNADVAVRVSVVLVVGSDTLEAEVFTLGAGVGLEGDGVEAGDVSQVVDHFLHHLHVALNLFDRGEGVELADSRPGDRHHFGGGVELHGAGSERDHGGLEAEVLGGKLVEVSHHLGFGVVGVEDRVSHVFT
mmetsp:Transcript_28930/g.50887  ORF Transcript_28930/g.50887 Transcript_28930/m.50887 type:complete len:344 (-) Transcript_28930:1552-2583(-)